MAVRACLRWPHPTLRRAALPVEAVTAETRILWDDMIDTMEAMPGVGLAAPQIGVALALAVVDASPGRGRAVRMANPVILSAASDLAEVEEASPNLPGVSARIARPASVTVRFLNAGGEIEERAFQGLWAASVQHQIDHLAGRMYFDRLSPLKRRMLIARAAKLRGRAA